MTEFGKTLREAREQKGLTIAQIAEQTHLLPQIVEDLEHEDFHRISAPIYGRGFVKLYCEAVGLEPKPLVDEFMAILSGERVPAIKMREVALPAEPPPPPPPPPPPVYTQPELGEPESPVENARQETRDANEVQDERPKSGDAAPAVDAISSSRPVDAESFPRQVEQPPQLARQYHPDYARAALGANVNFGRLAILAGGAIALLVLLVLGGRALYRASMGISEPPVDATSSSQPVDAISPSHPVDAKSVRVPVDAISPSRPVDAESLPRPNKETSSASTAEKSPRQRTPRTPKEVPPLYID